MSDPAFAFVFIGALTVVIVLAIALPEWWSNRAWRREKLEAECPVCRQKKCEAVMARRRAKA